MNVNEELSYKIFTFEKMCFPDNYWSLESIKSTMCGEFGLYFISDYGYAFGQKIVDDCELLRIGVLPEYRNKGNGLDILNEFIRVIDTNKIFLEFEDGNIAAEKLYKSAGFYETGKRKDYYGIGRDAILMELNTIKLPEIEGAIFDLDGTLIDSMKLWVNMGSEFLEERGKTPEKELFKKLLMWNHDETAHYFKTVYGVDGTVAEIKQGIYDSADRIYDEKAELKEGIYSFLKKLKARGVKCAVATATGLRHTEIVLKRLDIYDFFDCVYTVDCVGKSKNFPDIYETALKALGTDKDKTFIFEDALHAIKTAKKANFNVVGIYDKSYEEFSEKIKKLVDFYTDSYNSLEI